MENAGYLRNKSFDLLFIFGIFLCALTCGILVTNNNDLFFLIFTLDLWLLGYHHVISTYSRFFDKNTWQQHYKLITYLPLLVILSVVILVKLFGAWLIVTIYLYWQFYHYLRQSDGISKAFLSKSQNRAFGFGVLNRITVYFVPLAAFLNLSTRDIEEFLWMPVWVATLPEWLVNIFNVVAAFLLLRWIFSNTIALINKKISKSYYSYMLSHYSIFIIAYAMINNINYGWLTINIWHNFQYIIFVWLFNTNKFKNGVEKNSLLLSFFSQPQRFLQYMAIFFIATSIIYGGLEYAVNHLQSYFVIPLIVVVYQTINFHHYIVDSLIWKLKKTEVKNNILPEDL